MTASLARTATLRKFNPGAMQSDEEIVRQFVVHRHQFETVIEVLKENISSDSNQHLLVIAPRGRGKTMLLVRVAAELRREPELSDRLLPVRFSEESMEVLGIADFWLECLLHLSNTLNDTDPDRAEALRETHADLATIMDNMQLEQRARAAVLEVADALNRQLVLMIENLQDLTSDADKNFGWQLRKILQTEPRIILVASATSHFEGLLEVDQAFFELFREIVLPPLNTKECQRLWQVATGQSIETRGIKPLEILTGGSPRLLIFVASFSRHYSVRQLMEELVSLIDDHTEYFRGHLEALPPKERRVYTAVLDLWQAVTAREVAHRARMDIRPTSSLLRRLVSRGAVSVKPEEKNKYYYATERLHSIYYKLRRERNEAAVVQGLVMFMAVFYTDSEFLPIAMTMLEESREAPALRSGMQLAMRSDDTAREHLMTHMSFEDCQDVRGEDTDTGDWLQHRMSLAAKAYDQSDFTSALSYCEEIIEHSNETEEPALKEHVATALFNRGLVLGRLERVDEALESCAEIVKRYANESSSELQMQVAKSVALSSNLMGNHADVTNLYVDWYRRLPIASADLLRDFYNVTLHLYGAGLGANRLVEILESDTSKADMQRPLIVALRQEAGEKVRAPAEILEVAADVREEMIKIRSEVVISKAAGN